MVCFDQTSPMSARSGPDLGPKRSGRSRPKVGRCPPMSVQVGHMLGNASHTSAKFGQTLPHSVAFGQARARLANTSQGPAQCVRPRPREKQVKWSLGRSGARSLGRPRRRVAAMMAYVAQLPAPKDQAAATRDSQPETAMSKDKPKRANAVRFGPDLAETRSALTNLSQNGPNSAKSNSTWPGLGKNRSNSAKVGRKLADVHQC